MLLKRLGVCALLVMTLITLVTAQFNLKVAYTGLRADFENTNTSFNLFDTNNALDKPYGTMHYLQGLDIGIRYKWNRIGLEAGWTNMQSYKIDALGTNIDQNWRISSSEFYTGIENYFGNFGFGASVGFNKMRYKVNIPGSRDRKSIVSESILSSKIYIFTTVSSGSTAISIKPYYVPKWGQFDITSFNESLGVSQSKSNEYLTGFGFSIVLYNGPQD